MRQVRLFIASTLDGYIAREGGEIDWLFEEKDYGFRAFLRSVDTVVMGRKTYDLAAAFPEFPYAGKKVTVFSRTKAGTRDPHAEFTTDTPAGLVKRLREQPGKDIWLVGGGELVRAFLDANLVGHVDLFIHPVLLGSGRSLFPKGGVNTSLRLEKTETYRSGLVRLTYSWPEE